MYHLRKDEARFSNGDVEQVCYWVNFLTMLFCLFLFPNSKMTRKNGKKRANNNNKNRPRKQKHKETREVLPGVEKKNAKKENELPFCTIYMSPGKQTVSSEKKIQHCRRHRTTHNLFTGVFYPLSLSFPLPLCVFVSTFFFLQHERTD